MDINTPSTGLALYSIFIALPMLILYIIMIVKYFQIAADTRKNRDTLNEIRDLIAKRTDI